MQCTQLCRQRRHNCKISKCMSKPPHFPNIFLVKLSATFLFQLTCDSCHGLLAIGSAFIIANIIKRSTTNIIFRR